MPGVLRKLTQDLEIQRPDGVPTTTVDDVIELQLRHRQARRPTSGPVCSWTDAIVSDRFEANDPPGVLAIPICPYE